MTETTGRSRTRGVLDWLDDDDLSSPRAKPATVAANAKPWPVYVVIGVSVVGAIGAAVMSPLVSTVTYLVLMGVGCGLLFYRRYDAIGATRSAGGAGVVTVEAIEKVAIAALTVACLVNGIVIAWEVAGWDLWDALGWSSP
ncbi:hypothetical protein ACQ86B_29085 (plasmid) [Mycolicibacterium aichiense]|uniref:hypothetical protein n=1 Tax=Mycolicibacterium aichiense TaxID=1799 RepID=UPI003D679EF9